MPRLELDPPGNPAKVGEGSERKRKGRNPIHRIRETNRYPTPPFSPRTLMRFPAEYFRTTPKLFVVNSGPKHSPEDPATFFLQEPVNFSFPLLASLLFKISQIYHCLFLSMLLTVSTLNTSKTKNKKPKDFFMWKKRLLPLWDTQHAPPRCSWHTSCHDLRWSRTCYSSGCRARTL